MAEENDESKSAINDEIKDFVVKAVNGAVSTHLSRALSKRDEALKTELQGMFAQFKPEPSEPKKTETGNDPSDAIKQLTSKYEAQLSEFKRMAESEKSQREAEYKKRLYGEERDSLKSYLGEQGVPSALVPAAVAYLHTELKRVARDDDGNIQYVSQEKGPTGSYEDRLPLKEGVQKFLSSDEGKHFLPAKSVAGSGNTGGNAGAKSSKPQGNVESLIMDFINGAV